jgi:2-oxoacid:acceptor oxidoreductase gamma subunit (pyruvate/2-ketoisovalerate family)
MIEIRIHGYGGQGSVIASQMLAYAFFLENKHAQAFPTFGAERRGAPVEAFVRQDDKFINLRSKVISPNYVVIMAERLSKVIDVTVGLKKDGLLLINSNKNPKEFDHLKRDFQIKTLDMNAIAIRHGLGSKNSPFINTAMLGGFVGLTHLVDLESLFQTVRKFITSRVQENIEAIRESYYLVQN